jgi:hypothetical protein
VERVSDRVAMIKNGRIVFESQLADLDQSLDDIFFARAGALATTEA